MRWRCVANHHDGTTADISVHRWQWRPVAPRRYYLTVDDEVPPIASGLRCCWCSVVWLGVCAPSLPLSEGLVKSTF